MKLRYPDGVQIFYESSEGKTVQKDGERFADIIVETGLTEGCLRVYLTARATPVKYLRMRWNALPEEVRGTPVHVMGDVWERTYGDSVWEGIRPERCMPWVCAVSNGSDQEEDCSGRLTECFGVRVRPGAICFWQYDTHGVTLWMDVRNGGRGVLLEGRKLTVCDVVFGNYENMSAWQAVNSFYAGLCKDPLRADHKVYGSNNWYYAYGNSSRSQILKDAKLIAELCEGFENRPYMVIDDGWTPNHTDGPWISNESFGDMRTLADEIRALNVRPGIWVRYLNDSRRQVPGITQEMRLERDPAYLDPSHPLVLRYVREITQRLVREWGYELIKHDFSTYDIFGFWGMQRRENLAEDGWAFYDRTRTSAEIVVDFYRTILEAAEGKALILGCNVMGHLAAGLVHSNRIGDDTSGLEWNRTRKMGVHTLAYHGVHSNFFDPDADCVGITGKVDWTLNREWMKLLAASGTPLFVSCDPEIPDEKMKAELREAFRRSSIQEDHLEPVDWMENSSPEWWKVNGVKTHFNWYAPEGTESFHG